MTQSLPSALTLSLLMLTALAAPASAQEAPPLAVDDPALIQAARNACRLDRMRTPWLFGLESMFDHLKEPNRRQYDAWLVEYNRFIETRQDQILVRFAEQMHSRQRHRILYSDAECKILVPAYGLAWTASHIDVRPGDIKNGWLVSSCDMRPCVGRPLDEIPEKCNIAPLSDTYVKDCNKPE
ncbi:MULTISPECIES: hypothetical protein [unclassified Methylobacterium]|jgi:hypothetical protein|uniref:hypothetical protein n=1 Tax=unclassified Methylobacterium TaxID=2615210 RepID=UPI0008E04C11|nr:MULTISPECIES: hypothetical protein [unclassified Methylobacterium]NGM38525.1 hypothetical protein [Methylobacterium sp. DB0501]SFF72276.1 hypothetical protein SAMN04487844_14228 [Methylobacterium sp. yr596]